MEKSWLLQIIDSNNVFTGVVVSLAFCLILAVIPLLIGYWAFPKIWQYLDKRKKQNEKKEIEKENVKITQIYSGYAEPLKYNSGNPAPQDINPPNNGNHGNV